MRQKYLIDSHPNDPTVPQTGSHIWKCMLQVRDQMEESITWEINEGKASFLWDNWLGTGQLGNRFSVEGLWQISHFIEEGKWNLAKLHDHFPSYLISYISQYELCIQSNLPDNMIWMRTASGSFSVKSAYEMVRQVKTKSFVDNLTWQKGLPSKISFFMSFLLSLTV